MFLSSSSRRSAIGELIRPYSPLPALRDPGVRRIEQPEVTNRLYEALAFSQTAQTPGGLGAYAFATGRRIDEAARILCELQTLYRQT